MADVGIVVLFRLPLVQKETQFVVFLGVLHSKFLGVLLSGVTENVKTPSPLKVRFHLQDTLFICYKQSPGNTPSVAFSQRSSSRCLIKAETFSDIINNLRDYKNGKEAGFFEKR
ncbi:hypothetical protein TNCV_4370851 [Trichonephila clavipes]|nr:hypothetical protein TNCV_4370851 [Trichonephila clavipes]